MLVTGRVSIIILPIVYDASIKSKSKQNRLRQEKQNIEQFVFILPQN